MNTKRIKSNWLYSNRRDLPWQSLIGAELLIESGQRHLITAIEERQWPAGPLITVRAQEGPANRNGLYNIEAFNNGPFKVLVSTVKQADLLCIIIAQIEQKRIEQEIYERERQEGQCGAQEQAELHRFREARAQRENYIAILKSKMMSHQTEEANSIREFIATRNIPYLVHFTRIENVMSILKNGITPRASLVSGFHFNDEMRLDRFSESTSFSISFPNWQMFYRCRCAERNRGANWVVLAISTEALLTHPCLFFPTNAASRCFQDEGHEAFSTRMGITGLNSMFPDDPPGVREARGLPDKTTTDPQAEILVFDRVPPEQIGAISLMRSDGSTEALIRRQMPTLRLNVGGKLFNRRADYKFWQANAKVPLSDTIIDFDDVPL
jgi:ssDNA thymidine ADP-ribosyltransferase, DarT